MKFIPDSEINLNTEDYLGTLPYVELLKKTIAEADASSTFTIGLIGEWGSGKSSIINTLEEELSAGADKPNFVIYDAWKYSNDSFRRTFLTTLKKKLKKDIKPGECFDAFYQNQQQDVAVTQRPAITMILTFIGILLLSYFFTPLSVAKDAMSLSITISSIGLLVTIVSKAFVDLKKSVSTPYLFAAEQFEACFEHLMDQVQNDRTIIVIDNLDRCHKELSYELLTVVKTFMGKRKNTIFVIPFDETAIFKHLSKGETLKTEEAQEFLRKLFSVVIRMRPLKKFDLFDFTQQLVNKYELNFTTTTIDIISKEYATNPRRIIQFCNNLIVELENVALRYPQSGFEQQHQSLICKALLIREEWPTIYPQIARNPSLLNTASIDGTDDENKEACINFLKMTVSVGKDDFVTWNKIFSLTDTYSELPAVLIAAINNGNKEELDKAINACAMTTEQLYRCLVEALRTELQRYTYATGVKNTLELICKADWVLPASDVIHSHIQDELAKQAVECIRHITNTDSFCRYAASISRQGLNYLNNSIQERLNNDLQNTEHTAPATWTLFNAFSAHNQSDLNITARYEQDYILRVKLPENNADYLQLTRERCTPSFIMQQIQALPPRFFTEEQLSKLIYLIKNGQSEAVHAQELIQQLNRCIKEKEKESTQLENIVKFLHILLNDIEVKAYFDAALLKQLLPVITIITNHFLTPGTEKDTTAKTLIPFLFSIYERIEDQEITSAILLFSQHTLFYKKEIIAAISTLTLSEQSKVDTMYNLLMMNETIEVDEKWYIATEKVIQAQKEDEYLLDEAKIAHIIKRISTSDKKANKQLQDQWLTRILCDNRCCNIALTREADIVSERLPEMPENLIKDILLANENNQHILLFCFNRIGRKATHTLIILLIDFILTKTKENHVEWIPEQLAYLSRITPEEIHRLNQALQISSIPDNIKEQCLFIIKALSKHIGDFGSNKRLSIHSAQYGAADSYIDIASLLATRKLQSRIAGDLATNDFMGTDPIPGTPKELIIDYSYNGFRQQKTFQEGTYVEIP